MATFNDLVRDWAEAGVTILMNDRHDIPKVFHTDEEVEQGAFPVHHWPLGVAILALALIGKAVYKGAEPGVGPKSSQQNE